MPECRPGGWKGYKENKKRESVLHKRLLRLKKQKKGWRMRPNEKNKKKIK